jgi:pyruvate-formate lyase-activating enzyme
MKVTCELEKQGFKPGRCLVMDKSGKKRACEITLKVHQQSPQRLITSAHLSRPEHYFSIYQSGCNMDCLKCHSWSFSQQAEGKWYSPEQIFDLAKTYASSITFKEPRNRATSYHASDVCRGCGVCVEISIEDFLRSNENKNQFRLKPSGKKNPLCPNQITPEQLILSPQGIGPARNILAFTGGDLACQPDFYAACAEKIKENRLPLWILFETNGYGLTTPNLDRLKEAGIDSFWLDLKAFNPDVHRKLTGVNNEMILRLPEEIVKRNFTLEILTLFIPGWVESDQIKDLAQIIARVDTTIPFTILAFFPEYKLKDTPSPSLNQMTEAYERVRETGLKNIRLGNIGVFVKNDDDFRNLYKNAREAI